MRFQVPQFIEKETRIIGPLTLRQFGWFLGAAIIFVMVQFVVKGSSLLIVAIILAGIAGALSFLKIDEVPLPTYIGHAFTFFMSDKKFLFKKDGEDNPQ